MPFSNRLHIVAFRGCLIAVVVFLSAALHAQENNAEKQRETPTTQQTQPKPSQPLPITVVGPISLEREKAVEPDWNKTDCNKPQNHDEADLCEQRRMAKAAEDTVALNKIQIGLGIAGAILLILTLIYSRRAAEAASEAAKAATSQAQAAQDTLTKIQRPHVFIFDVVGIHAGLNENFDGHIPYTVANYGQTPAIVERMEARISRGQTPEQPGPETDDHPLIVSPILGAQQKRENLQVRSTFWLRSKLMLAPDPSNPNGPRQYAAEVVKGQELFVWIRIGYRGAITTGHETSACWRYDPEPCQFIQYGGAEYNYTR